MPFLFQCKLSRFVFESGKENEKAVAKVPFFQSIGFRGSNFILNPLEKLETKMERKKTRKKICSPLLVMTNRVDGGMVGGKTSPNNLPHKIIVIILFGGGR